MKHSHCAIVFLLILSFSFLNSLFLAEPLFMRNRLFNSTRPTLHAAAKMVFAPDPLPYPHDALAGKGMSEEQVVYHYEKHTKSYAAKLNAAAESDPALSNLSLIEAVRTLKGPLYNSAGQLMNHNIFWNCMGPHGGGDPVGAIAEAIEQSFGSFAKLKEEFNAAANAHFGSGWAWLVHDAASGKLKVYQTHDGGCPFSDPNLTPILGCDLWEHSYYIDYRNEKPRYVEAWWGLINWDFANAQLVKAKKNSKV